MRSTDWCSPMQNGPSVGDAEAILDVLLGWGTSAPFISPSPRKPFLPLGQLDHVNRRSVAAFAAGPTSQRRFQLPDWHIARTPERIERQARPAFATMAFDLQVTVAALRHWPMVGEG
jgi:hypothetical protein